MYKLIMLKEPILVSDEEIKDGHWFYDIIAHPNCGHIQKCEGESIRPSKTRFKIIAGIPELPAIDFSALSEEDCEKIGWVDVEKLADEFSNTDTFADASSFIEGFEVAQSLNEKKFSEEDVERAFESGWQCRNNSGYRSNGGYQEDFDSFIESIFQPKVFDVEVEMELVEQHHLFIGYPTKHPFFEEPKITSNSIKIIKVL